MIVELTQNLTYLCLQTKVSGSERNYLVSDNFKNKLDKIVYTSGN